MRMIEVSEKQLLALKAVVHGCNTNKRLVGASYMKNIRSEKPEMISYYEAIKTVDEMLSQHTIEAEPVVHGRWETFLDEDWGGNTTYLHGHKKCGYVVRSCLEKGTPYCPNCGAKMDGGADDATD